MTFDPAAGRDREGRGDGPWTCACGCGLPPPRGSKYAQDHFRLVVTARKKARGCRRYAKQKGLRCEIGAEDVLDMLRPGWPESQAWELRRIDRSGHFVPGNVKLLRVATSGARASVEDDAGHAGRLLWDFLSEAQARTTSPDELAAAYERQRGRCALTGRILDLHATRRDQDHPYVLTQPGPPTLVVAMAGAIADRLGVDRLVQLAHEIVRAAPRQRPVHKER